MATKQPKKNNYVALRKCFQALVDRKQVNINISLLELMIKHELLMNTEDLDEHLLNVLPFMLVVYMRNWPGWQKSKEYFSGKLNFREWFTKFRQYIVVRLNYLVKNGYEETMKSINAERAEAELKTRTNHIEKGTQTDHSAPKEIYPFTISIECPPKMLSSLGFTDRKDDVILSQHIEVNWIDLSIKELLNWPHVGVQFNSAKLQFKRFNRSEYLRFINFTNCEPTIESRNLIEEINIVDSLIPQELYSVNVLWSYASQYMEILGNLDNVDETRLEIIEAVLEEFLKDGNEWQLNNTAATNTSVLFNIGGCTFVRNKKLSKGKNNLLTDSRMEIGYCETLIPKIETELTYFNGIQDTSTSDITFTHLNAIEKQFKNGKITADSLFPVIVFFCLFCDIKFNSHKDLMVHLQKEHGMEPDFMCTKCFKCMSVMSLSKDRWKHVCAN